MMLLHLRKRIDSETLHLPELRPLIGKTVEIIVRDEAAGEPADASPYDALYELAGQDVVDPEACKALREASRIGR